MDVRYFFNPADKGFYLSDVHGELEIQVPDPDWVPPPSYIPNPDYDPDVEGSEAHIEVPYSGDIPTITVPNPDCRIPAEANEISEETYLQMLNGESEDDQIDADSDGLPILAPVPLDEAYERIIKQINEGCSSAITGGFTSDALGAAHRYSSDLEDQLNISGNVLDAQMGVSSVHACYDTEDVRDFRLHSPEQMIQVGRDFKTHKIACLQQADSLRTSAKAAFDASDKDTLLTITWSDPE